MIAEPSVTKFFKDQGIGGNTAAIDELVEDVLAQFKIYIERNERPYNYMKFDDEEESARAIGVQGGFDSNVTAEEMKALQEENLEKILKQ